MPPRSDVVAEIRLDALRKNVRAFQSHIHPAKVIGVVKANAYGHGVIPVSMALREEGVSRLAVAVVEEAWELRDAGITVPILILGKIWRNQIPDVFDLDLQIIVASNDDLTRLSEAARDYKETLRVHLKIDTGMGRLGFFYTDYEPALNQIIDDPGLELTGVMSHLSTADTPESEHTQTQVERFGQIHRHISSFFPNNPPLFHLGNSAGTLYLKNIAYDGVRLGLAMYGMTPATSVEDPFPLRQMMQLKTRVAYIKKFPPAYPIGYGATYRTSEDSVIAVCSGGYEDGIPRRYGNTGEVLIHGKRFPIVGNVSMDTFMVDVRDERLDVGDEVVLLGTQGDENIPIAEMAAKLGVIPYEVTCGISARVARSYTDQD
ncbi:MAG: Alanine racemase 1 [Candidatus Marinimicrobia bacterium]|nr:Alanine racemase 1 [Candidatus Neomarinimicrobiota bacterium]